MATSNAGTPGSSLAANCGTPSTTRWPTLRETAPTTSWRASVAAQAQQRLAHATGGAVDQQASGWIHARQASDGMALRQAMRAAMRGARARMACLLREHGPMLDAERLADSSVLVLREPFPLLVAHDQLPASAQPALEQDFPRYGSAGFFPYEEADCGPAVQSLAQQITSPAFADALGARWASNTSVPIRRWSRCAVRSTSATAPSIPIRDPRSPRPWSIFARRGRTPAAAACASWRASTISMRWSCPKSGRCTAPLPHSGAPTIPSMATCPTRANVRWSRWRG